jgi:predicted nuclease of predicted toxin-antitoxin system
VSAALVAHLRASGHDVSYIAELSPAESDAEIMAHAQQEERLLLTEDKDFGELVFRRGGMVPGLVLIRIDPERATLIRNRLDMAIAGLGESLFGKYTVVEEARFRSRPLRS